MGKKKVLFVITTLLISGVTACSKSGSEGSSVPNGTNLLSKLTGEPMKGYKSFNFGMPAAQVAKLPECVDEYKKMYTFESGSENYRAKLTKEAQPEQAQIPELQQLLKEYDEFQTLNRCSALGKEQLSPEEESRIASVCRADQIPRFAQIESKRARLAELLGKGDEINKEVAEYEAKDAAFDKRVAEFAPDIIEGWSRSGVCHVEFMGDQQVLKPVFEQGKLIRVEMDLGEFNNEKYQSLVKALAEKYGLTHEVTTEQVSAFNEAQLAEVVSTFGNGQIGLFATNKNDINVIRYAVEGGHNSEGVLSLNRYMKLVYTDAAHAANITSAASVGKTKAEDL